MAIPNVRGTTNRTQPQSQEALDLVRSSESPDAGNGGFTPDMLGETPLTLRCHQTWLAGKWTIYE